MSSFTEVFFYFDLFKHSIFEISIIFDKMP